MHIFHFQSSESIYCFRAYVNSTTSRLPGNLAPRQQEHLVHLAKGDYTRARALLEENLLLYSALGKPHRTAYPLFDLARLLFLSRHHDQAKTSAMAEESLALFQEVGNRRLIAYLLDLLAEIHLQQSKPARAGEYCEKSLATFTELEYHIGIAESHMRLARVKAFQDNQAAARAHYQESWRSF